jgi:uncharacterized phiE125 gp8 family phage protein
MSYHLLLVSHDADPPVEPISLERAKLHLRVDGDDEDDLIALWITVAREACEHHTNRALVGGTYELHLASLPRGRNPIEIPLGGVTGLVSLTYRDAAGDEITLDPSAYEFRRREDSRSTVVPVVNTTWPAGTQAVLKFEAGQNGATQRQIAGMLLALGHLHEHRGDTAAPMPPAVTALWDSRVF